MKKSTLEYIKSRANKSETSSIVAVSCPDIRALLSERAELLAALQQILKAPDYMIGEIARAAIEKATA